MSMIYSLLEAVYNSMPTVESLSTLEPLYFFYIWFTKDTDIRFRELLRLICDVRRDGDGSGDVRCLRSCVNQMKEMETETHIDTKFGVQLRGDWPGDVFIQRVKSVASQKWRTLI